MRVLFSGALAQIIVRFYPYFKQCDYSPSGTVRHMWGHPLLRSFGFTAVMVALACSSAGCDGTGKGSAGVSTAPTTTTPVPPNTPSVASVTKAFDSIHRRYSGDILGICMGAIDKQTRAIKCYGRVSPSSKKKPTRTTLFQIGSVSKTFTATLLALRVNSGAVGLEDPVGQYIPAGQDGTQVPGTMTLLDLADHYSGLPRDTPSGEQPPPTADDYLAQAGPCSASSSCRAGKPGQHYSYSNYGFGVLGELLAKHDGFSEGATSAWEQDNQANVSGPLGLNDTHSWYGWRAISQQTFDARRARPRRHAVPPYFPPAPYADGAAGLYSSANDMMKWMSFSMGLSGTSDLNAARPYLYGTSALLRPREDQSDKRRRVGLAWRVDTHGSGKSRVDCVYKDGLTRGFTTSMIFIKGKDVGAFVMLNTEPDTPAIAAALVNALPSAKKIARSACGVGGG
jgi:serine-type D-Ala-D-Ala carboxypeptidase/endopeptidase